MTDNSFATFPMIISLSYGKSDMPRLRMMSIVTSFRVCRGVWDKIAFLLLIPINILLIPLEIIKYFFLLLCHYCCRQREKPAAVREASDLNRRVIDASNGGGFGTEVSQKNANNSAALRADYLLLERENQELRSQLETLYGLIKVNGSEVIGDGRKRVGRKAKSSRIDGSDQAANADPSRDPHPKADEDLKLQQRFQKIATVAFFANTFVTAMESSGAGPDGAGLPLDSDANLVKSNELFLADFENDLLEMAKREIVTMDALAKLEVQTEQTILSIICEPNAQNMIVINFGMANLILKKFPNLFRLLLVYAGPERQSYPKLETDLNCTNRFFTTSSDTVVLINIKSPTEQGKFYREYFINNITTSADYSNRFKDVNDVGFREILKITAPADFV